MVPIHFYILEQYNFDDINPYPFCKVLYEVVPPLQYVQVKYLVLSFHILVKINACKELQLLIGIRQLILVPIQRP